MSAAEIARKIHVSGGLLTQWRQGLALIQIPKAYELADVVGVSRAWLLTGEGEAPPWAASMPRVTAPIEEPDEPVVAQRKRSTPRGGAG